MPETADAGRVRIHGAVLRTGSCVRGAHTVFALQTAGSEPVALSSRPFDDAQCARLALLEPGWVVDIELTGAGEDARVSRFSAYDPSERRCAGAAQKPHP